MAYTGLKIAPVGGCSFSATLVGDDDDFDKFLGTVEVGEINDDSQWDGDRSVRLSGWL